MCNETILRIEELSVRYQSSGAYIEDISLSIARGRTLGLLGESGSGKSTVCNAVLGLLDTAAVTLGGSIRLLDKEILRLPWNGREQINGKDIGVVLQNPMTAFNPCLRIRSHFAETLCSHLLCSKRDAVFYGLEMLKRVGMRDRQRIMDSYPHQLSGGMLQRVMVAIAISLNPVLIIADEPTTALDAGSETIILELLKQVMQDLRPAMLLVSHDMDVMAALADDIAVMKGGRIVEQNSLDGILSHPQHSCTKELVGASQMMEVAWCSP